MSTHDVISLLLQFGLCLIAALTLIVTIMHHMYGNRDKEK